MLVGAGVAGGLLLVAVVWCGWLLWSTSQDLQEVERRAEIMRSALVRGDAEGTRRALAGYQEAAESAEQRTSGPTWWLLERAPVLGDDAAGVATVATVLADLGRDGLPPVADAAEQVTADAFRPRGHVFPVDRIAAMAGPAGRSEAAFDAADAELDAVDSARFVGPLQRRFDTLRTLVADARSALGSTYRASRLIPRMLGDDRPRRYLLVLQNNAELRSAGGLPGALSLVEASAGRVRIVEQDDTANLGRSAEPVLPLTGEEEALFGRILGTYPVDATLTPDFQRAAALIRARWEAVKGSRLDGIVFVDPVAVSYLLTGVGTVPVPGGEPVHAGNVVSLVENEVYLRTSDRAAHSAYQEAVAKAVFDAFADGVGDPATAIRGLVTAVSEGRVRMQHFDPADQAEVAGTAIAGEFPTTSDGAPEVGLYLNDAGPTKMQFYLRYDAQVFSRSCTGGVQEIGGSMELHNDAPPGARGLPPAITGVGVPGLRVQPGEQALVAYLTSPIGGEVRELSIDGQRVSRPVVQPFAGRQVATVGIRLEPGQRQRIDFVVRSGPDQPRDPRLRVTPGAFPGSANATVPSSCAVR